MSYNRKRKRKSYHGKWNPKVYKKVSDGIYHHKKLNQLEFDVPEIITSMGGVVNEENKNICMEALREVAKKMFPDVPIKETSILAN